MRLPFGGEIWEQYEFPFNTCYIISGLPDGLMARSTDPRTTGNTLISKPDGGGQTTYTQVRLAELLERTKYTLRGQLHDLIIQAAYEAVSSDS